MVITLVVICKLVFCCFACMAICYRLVEKQHNAFLYNKKANKPNKKKIKKLTWDVTRDDRFYILVSFSLYVYSIVKICFFFIVGVFIMCAQMSNNYLKIHFSVYRLWNHVLYNTSLLSFGCLILFYSSFFVFDFFRVHFSCLFLFLFLCVRVRVCGSVIMLKQYYPAYNQQHMNKETKVTFDKMWIKFLNSSRCEWQPNFVLFLMHQNKV